MSTALATPLAPPPNIKKSSYQPQLDGLRGLAIMSVLLHHFGVKLPGVFDWGPIGVRMFFLLSGFLITQSLWRLQSDAREAGGGYWLGLFGFHARRMTRLTPVLWVMLAAAAFLLGLPEFRDAIVWHLGFASNFYALHLGKWPDAASHLWSLSVQEQFYLLWPFVILITPRKSLPWVLAGLVVVAFAFRAATIQFGYSDFLRWVMLPGVIDSFAFGALVACAKKSGRPLPCLSGWSGAAVGMAAFGCFVAARLLRFGPFPGAWAAGVETLENIFFVWLLLRTAAGWKGAAKYLFENPVLMYVGRISYGLYIFHVLVHITLSPWLLTHGFSDYLFVRTTILTVVSVGIASISYYYVELPLTMWVRRREVTLPGVRPQAA